MSPEAKNTVKRLLAMYKANEIGKLTDLYDVSAGPIAEAYQYERPDGQDVEFTLPMDDIRELAHYGILTLTPRVTSKGKVSGWKMLILPQALEEAVHSHR